MPVSPQINTVNTYPVRNANRPAASGSRSSTQFSYVDVNRNGEFEAPVDFVILSRSVKRPDWNDAQDMSRTLNYIADRERPDLNGDGVISSGEILHRPNAKDLRRLDEDGDGTVNEKDTFWVTFAQDQNGDGRFSSLDKIRHLKIQSLSNEETTFHQNGFLESMEGFDDFNPLGTTW